MYFKSIEMAGFKSFVDPTKVTFGKGLTGIVGPNGCGKSNISDAIRWVLGEQRPKLLRGAKMDDFIFNGSSGRKPGGLAEVSITISDIGGMVTRPELAAYDEITVTRRLYRSGESEYLINKTVCRLKDVVDLFLDTGISTRAFSIIEQDQVQRIVTSKPEERRFIIEEAAGIMKYKHRRQDALNKLENSKTNLERVSDIINELERQRNSLKRQASKAERYKGLKTEMAQLVLATSAEEYKGLKSAESAIAQELTRLEEARASLEAEVGARRNRTVTMQAGINESAEKMAAMKDEEYQLGSAIERNQNRINIFNSQIEESVRAASRLAGEIVEIDRRLESLHAEVAEKNETLERLKTAVGEKSVSLEQKRRELVTAQSGIDGMTKEIAFSEREMATAAGRAASISASLASQNAKLEMLDGRVARITKEQEEAQIALGAVRGQRDQKQNELLQNESGFGELQTQMAELSRQRAELQRQKSDKEETSAALKTEIAQQTARLDSLREIDSANEGYQEGIRSLLQLKSQNDETAARLKGSLLERIRADKRIESALETVLGDKLQALLTDTPQDAVSAIGILKSRKLGRGTLLPLSGGNGTTDAPQVTGLPGVIGLASDMVQADEQTLPLVHRLLAGVVFVDTLETAVRLNGEMRITCVTLEGDVVDRSGVMTGGSGKGSSAGILERKRSIEELGGAISATRQKLETLSGEMAAVASNLAQAESGIAETAAKIKEAEMRMVHGRKDLESLDAEIRRQEMRLQTFATEVESIALDQESIRVESARQGTELDGLNRQKAELETEILAARARQESAREDLKRLQEAVSAVEVELASQKGELNMAQADKQRLEQQMAESVSRTGAIRAEMEDGVNRKKELEASIVELKEETHANLEKRHSITGQVHRLSEELDEMRSTLQKAEEEAANATAAFEQTKESLNEARIKSSETVIRLQTLSDRASENGLDISTLETFDTTQLNIDECQQRLQEIRDQVHKIGDVNLEAIEDYRQVEERLTFLTAQRDDLLKSIDDINKVIEKINRTTRQLFEDTFVQVRQNFQEIFTRLFNGGEADMVLMDEANSLDSGIDIIARPPGKRKQSLTLMSAGEKSMTAVAVLFSVFKVKPSPFCLLDEVDAPLDDANIGRFKEMLKEFTVNTQFLVITHNQKTMAFADRLYGITMQDPGVSTVLSVDLVDTDDSSRERLQVVHG
ncbi:MAG: chromosome segregation protein SMC [Nitrospinae bacterium]|nr:chromosome segregation protein SMC [Nitrospinota bacterium]